MLFWSGSSQPLPLRPTARLCLSQVSQPKQCAELRDESMNSNILLSTDDAHGNSTKNTKKWANHEADEPTKPNYERSWSAATCVSAAGRNAPKLMSPSTDDPNRAKLERSDTTMMKVARPASKHGGGRVGATLPMMLQRFSAGAHESINCLPVPRGASTAAAQRHNLERILCDRTGCVACVASSTTSVFL
jgi:hypothetical protein